MPFTRPAADDDRARSGRPPGGILTSLGKARLRHPRNSSRSACPWRRFEGRCAGTVGIRGRSFSVPELAGVRRLSLATSDYRAAMTGFLNAVRKKQVAGQFSLLDRCELKLMQI